MSSVLNVSVVREPKYYHREYKNDIKRDPTQPSWLDQSKRFALVSLPFLSLYKPVSRPLSLAMGSLRTVTSVTQLVADIQQGKSKEIPYQLLQTSIAVASLAGTLFAHPMGMLITTGHDLLSDLNTLSKHLRAGCYHEALESSANIVNNALYLALFFNGGLELSIASFAMQILLGLYHSKNEFNKGNYLEGTGHFLMAMIRGNQMVEQIDLLRSLSGFERRAVVDVGSGSTKFCIADVDRKTNTIVRIILKESYAVPYQASLEASSDQAFDSKVRELGLNTFTKIDALCKEHGVQKISAVATEAFRKSTNGESFAREIQERTHIPLRIISQKEEGLIAFFSAASIKKDVPKDELVVWDIGTGSYQVTVQKEDEDVSVFMGNMGSVPFKNYIMDVIQGKDSSTLHPFSEEDYIAADRYARSLARKAYDDIKHRIKDVDGKVVGVGRLFTNSLFPFAKDQEKITRADLRNYIRSCYGKTKEELNDPFSEANLANATLVLAFMKALHIGEIYALDAATSQGMLCYAPYWT